MDVYGLASIPSLCYLCLDVFEQDGKERHAIVVCTRNPPKGNQHDSTHLQITAYGLCSLLTHNPDSNESVSADEARKAILEGARISRHRQELEFLLLSADKANERLKASRLQELRRIAAARKIQRWWIPICHDPRRPSTRTRLLKEFTILVDETEAELEMRREDEGQVRRIVHV